MPYHPVHKSVLFQFHMSIGTWFDELKAYFFMSMSICPFAHDAEYIEHTAANLIEFQCTKLHAHTRAR